MVNRSSSGLEGFIELGKSIFIRIGTLPFMLAAILIVFGVWNPAFLGVGNIVVASRESTYLILVTLAQMLALLSGGLDLSLGTSIALISVITGSVMVALPADPGVAVLVGCLAGIGVGAAVGFMNGLCIAFLRVSPFLVTLGMSFIASALALTLSGGGAPVLGLPSIFMDTLGYGRVLGVPVPVLITILVAGGVYLLLSWTRFGRYIYALGGSLEAAVRAGIPIRRYTVLTYVSVGILVGIAGVMLTARVGSGEPTLGLTLPLLSITAAVMGGISIFGGEGRLYGAVLGAVAITLLRNGMDVVGVGSFLQMVILGGILIMALALEQYRRSLRASRELQLRLAGGG